MDLMNVPAKVEGRSFTRMQLCGLHTAQCTEIKTFNLCALCSVQSTVHTIAYILSC